MKKILSIFILLLIAFITGCNNTEPEVKEYIVSFNSNGGNYIDATLVLEGELVTKPTSPEREDYMFLGWTKTLDDVDYFDFEETIIDSDLTLYAKWVSTLTDYSYLLDEYIPDEISTDLVLPRYVEDLMISWSSSNTAILSNDGNVNAPRNDTTLSMTIHIYDNSKHYEYTKEVTVLAVVLPELVAGECVFGYYSSWNFNGLTDDILKTVDVINVSFAFVNDDYTLDHTDIDDIIKKLSRCHEYGVRVVVSVQGYSSGGKNFSNASKSEAGRHKLATSMLEYIEKYNLDGIDIDWEYPGFGTGTDTKIDKANYVLLCEEIRKVFDEANEDYLVTAAIPAWNAVTSRFDVKGASEYLDFIHIMSYDLNSSGTATHHTPLYYSSYCLSGYSTDIGVKAFIREGVPKEKICVGCAFYGKYFKISGDDINMGKSASQCKTITFTKIKSLYLDNAESDAIYKYDEVAEAAYLIIPSENKVITYDDERSIAAKCNYAKSMGLGGVMIWEIGEDSTDTLLKTIYKTYKK